MKSIIFVFSILITSSAFAAKFASVTQMKSSAAEKLALIANALIANQPAFGDAGSVAEFSYTRKASEQNLNTVKQLNHAWAGIFSGDDAGSEVGSLSTEQLVEDLFYAIENIEGDYPQEFAKARADLSSALAAIKADPTLKIYSAVHGDEDGSWGVINVLDEKNSEVLLIRIGFSGT